MSFVFRVVLLLSHTPPEECQQTHPYVALPYYKIMEKHSTSHTPIFLSPCKLSSLFQLCFSILYSGLIITLSCIRWNGSKHAIFLVTGFSSSALLLSFACICNQH